MERILLEMEEFSKKNGISKRVFEPSHFTVRVRMTEQEFVAALAQRFLQVRM